jgi:hypothetical protein
MRRISLALALLGAVAAAGCGGAGGTNPPASQNKGLPDVTYQLTILGEKAVYVAAQLKNPASAWDPVANPTVATVNPDSTLSAATDPSHAVTVVLPNGGYVTGPGLKCGIDGTTLYGACSAQFAYQDPTSAASITLTANTGAFYPPSTQVGTLHGWAGACTSQDPTCSVQMSQLRFVAIRFSATLAGLGAHGPFADPAIHAPKYIALVSGQAGALDCTQCHGSDLQGRGTAPSCNQCHNLDLTNAAARIAAGNAATTAGTLNTANNPTNDHFSFNTTGCGPCHSPAQIMNKVADDASFITTTQVAAMLTSSGVAATKTGAPPYNCVVCHNSTFDPVWGVGVTTLVLPGSLTSPKTSKIIGLCGQCHMGRVTGASVAAGTTFNGKVVGTFNIASSPDAHFFNAATVMMGSNVQAAWQYGTNTYASFPPFYVTTPSIVASAPGPHGSPHGANCTQCHSAAGGDHFQRVDLANTKVPAPFPGYTSGHFPAGYPAGGSACDGCHSSGPYGRSLEATRQNIAALSALLLTKLNTYLVAGLQSPICFKYNDTSHKQLYKTTTHGGGVCDSTDTVAYGSATAPSAQHDPSSYKAALNLEQALLDPGSFVHNGDYITQALIDSILDLDPTTIMPCDAAPKSGSVYADDVACNPVQLYLGVISGTAGYAGTPIPRP